MKGGNKLICPKCGLPLPKDKDYCQCEQKNGNVNKENNDLNVNVFDDLKPKSIFGGNK